MNAHSIATYLREHGFQVTEDLVAKAMAATCPPVVTAQKMSAIEYAEVDWRAHGGEHDRTAGSIIDKMFIASGYSSLGVPKGAADKIPEWCTMACAYWLLCAGLDHDFNTSFLHTFNVEAFFTYGAKKNVNPARFDAEVNRDGHWVKIKAWHEQEGKTRTWIDRATIRGHGSLSILPGDLILFDWSGINDSDHIGIVRSFDGKTVHTIEGNRTGFGPNGEKWREAVVAQTYDITDKAIYGFGRCSALDFTDQEVK